jgi:hypothetical protein
MRIMSFAVLTGLLAAAPPAAAQTLSRDDIQRGVHPVRPAVEACLRARGGPGLVKVRLAIENGRVSTARVDGTGAAAGCIVRALQTARFRRTRQVTIVVYPFVSRPWAPAARPPPSSGLSREQISRGMRAVLPDVKRCGRAAAEPLAVTVRLDIVSGRVRDAHGVSPTAPAAVVRCVERAVARASFPGAQPTTVQYPFVLH